MRRAASGLSKKWQRVRPVRTSAGLDGAHELATNRATGAADFETPAAPTPALANIRNDATEEKLTGAAPPTCRRPKTPNEAAPLTLPPAQAPSAAALPDQEAKAPANV